MAKKHIYKVSFVNQGKVYEVYARQIAQSAIYGFVEIEELVFGEQSAVVIDPSEERLKAEFQGVTRSYIPVHAIIRIDQVEKEGPAKIVPLADGERVIGFPGPLLHPGEKGRPDR